MEFRELTDEQWGFIEPLLPPKAKMGRPRADDRKTMNGILYVLTTGCRWEDMPREYGSHKTAWRRHKELQEKGIWEKILREILNKGYEEKKVRLEEVALDSTTIEAKKGGRG